MEYIIADKVLAWRDEYSDRVDWRDFDRYSHKLNLPINMIVAGYLARLKILNYEKLINVVKNQGRDVDRNLRAVEVGYKDI